jgi:predicted PurR-regulated permease PerM
LEHLPERNVHETALLIERIVAVFLFGVLLVGVALVLRPFVTAILFAGILVISTWPMHEWLLRKGFSNVLATIVLVVLTLLVIVVPAVLMAPRLGAHLVELANRAQSFLNDKPKLPSWVDQLPLVGERLEKLWSQIVHGQIQEILSPYSDWLRTTVFDVGSALAEGLLQLVLALALAAMFWLRGDVIRAILENMAQRFAGPFGGKILLAAAGSVRGIAYGIIGTALAQAVALSIGLFIAGVPNAGVLGFLALLIALSQFGIFLVVIWGGAAWWLFSTGAIWSAVFMIVWGLFVSLVDNIIRPLLVGFGVSMPLILIFLGVFGGFLAFGFLGLFIGPTVLAIFYTLLQTWRQTATPS